MHDAERDMAPALPCGIAPGTPRDAGVLDAVVLRAGGARRTVAAGRILRIVESTAEPTPLPLAPAGVRGVACIDGRPFVEVETGGAGAAGGVLVVVAAAAGGLALRVDAVTRGDGAPPLDLAGAVPWLLPAAAEAPVRQPPAQPAATAAAARETLLIVSDGGRTAALPAGHVERVGLVTASYPLDGDDGGSGDRLVRIDGSLMAARRLADALPGAERGTGGNDRWAVVVRDGGRTAALLVDRLIGLESPGADRIVATALPGGDTRRWLDGATGPDSHEAPVPVVAPAALFGWDGPPAAPSRFPSPPPPRPSSGRWTADPAAAGRLPVLTVRVADVDLALPLGLAEGVLEPGARLMPRPAPGAVPVFDAAVALGRRRTARAGVFVRLRPDGGPALLLSVDRVLALAEPPSPWHAVDPLPPPADLAFDAVCRADGGTHWIYRVRRGIPAAVPPALRRSLAAARLGWADAGPGPGPGP